MDESKPAHNVAFGGSIARLSVSVRVLGDDLDPEEVTRLLGTAPNFAARKGDQRQSGSRPFQQRIGIWTFARTTKPSSEWELDGAIKALLGRLPSDLDVWRRLAERYSLDVFCGLFMSSDNQGTDVQPETLRLLADRGLALSFDLYGPPPGRE